MIKCNRRPVGGRKMSKALGISICKFSLIKINSIQKIPCIGKVEQLSDTTEYSASVLLSTFMSKIEIF